jgi:hypothetical protein
MGTGDLGAQKQNRTEPSASIPPCSSARDDMAAGSVQKGGVKKCESFLHAPLCCPSDLLSIHGLGEEPFISEAVIGSVVHDALQRFIHFFLQPGIVL